MADATRSVSVTSPSTQKAVTGIGYGRVCSSTALALAVAVFGTFVVGLLGNGESEPGCSSNCTGAELDESSLRGVWMRYEGRSEGQPLRFWYFHGDGHGLYRYGRVGLANTHSFDYRLDDAGVELRFRKSGEVHRTRLKIVEGKGRRWLAFADDPREPGARYYHERAPLGEAEVGSQPIVAGRAKFDRMWIDMRSHATGGRHFQMYQFNAPAIDGRGTGWFHAGDFDDWSTESLSYRLDGPNIELFFELAEQFQRTRFRIEQRGEKRTLVLDTDPRDFWASHGYTDAGPSFGQFGMWPATHEPGSRFSD